MPLYEYECRECGTHFEKLQRFGAAPPDACPNGHPAVHRLLSEPAIIFKGSGFYVTDNGRNKLSTTSGNGKESPASVHDTKTEDKATDKASDKTTDKATGKAAAEAA